MIWLAFCCFAQQEKMDSETAILKMLTKYVEATSLSGSIVSEVSDGKGVAKNTIKVSYEEPSKLSIQMTVKGRNGLPMSVVSDGENFRYDPPLKESLIRPTPGERLTEPVVVVNELTGRSMRQTVGQIYNAAHTSLAESTSLDLIIGYSWHLKDFQIHVASHRLVETIVKDDKKTYKIAGDWRWNVGDPPVGKFEMLVSGEFDLLSFKLTEPYGVGGRQVVMTISEKVDVKVGVPVPASTFKIDER